MAKYLFKGNYVGKGIDGLRSEGGTGRKKAVEKLVESLGGRLEALYYAFGPTDIYAIVELPDHQAATAASLMVNGSGNVKVDVVVLMSPEEIDQATKKAPTYRPPGG